MLRCGPPPDHADADAPPATTITSAPARATGPQCLEIIGEPLRRSYGHTTVTATRKRTGVGAESDNTIEHLARDDNAERPNQTTPYASEPNRTVRNRGFRPGTSGLSYSEDVSIMKSMEDLRP
jgi:hypothetical protein